MNVIDTVLEIPNIILFTLETHRNTVQHLGLTRPMYERPCNIREKQNVQSLRYGGVLRDEFLWSIFFGGWKVWSQGFPTPCRTYLYGS